MKMKKGMSSSPFVKYGVVKLTKLNSSMLCKNIFIMFSCELG